MAESDDTRPLPAGATPAAIGALIDELDDVSSGLAALRNFAVLENDESILWIAVAVSDRLKVALGHAKEIQAAMTEG